MAIRPRDHGIDPWLAGCLLLGLALRLLVLNLTVYHHADEVWQYIEPAYGLVTGDWIQTWDIRSGIRSWLIPLVLVGPVWLGQAISPETLLHVHLAQGLMALLSLGMIWAGWALGLRISRRHALVAAFVAAIWVEFAYFAPRTSSDALALSLLLPASALLVSFRETRDVRHGPLAGVLCGLGFVVRFPLGPAIAIGLLWAARLDWRRGWLPLGLGFAGGIACDVLANAVMGEWPLAWIWRNLFANVVANRSHAFGTEPAYWYAFVLRWQWGVLALPALPALWLGARRYPVLLAMGLTVIATHSLIAHKEYRFILLGVGLLVVLAAIGSVDLVDKLSRSKTLRRLPVGYILAAWIAASAFIALRHPFSINWTVGKAPVATIASAVEQPGMCGIATFRVRDVPFLSRALINRDVPLLLLAGPEAAANATANASRFNVLIAPTWWTQEVPAPFRLRGCVQPAQPEFEQTYCVYARPGPCSGDAGRFDYNRVLQRMDR